MTTGEKIRSIRHERGLTQMQLAEMAGIAVNTLRQYEGDRSYPRPKQLDLLANALGVPSAEITAALAIQTDSDNQKSLKLVDSGTLAISARIYPKENGGAILVMTYENGSMHILPDFSMPETEEAVTTWQLSAEDSKEIEALIHGYCDKRRSFLFSPEMGAGIALMLEKMAAKSKQLAESENHLTK